MTDSLDSLSPAWRKTLEAIERRQSSPVMLPLAIGAIVDIFEAGMNDGATIRFEDYEHRFRALAAKHQIKLKSGPWMPYLALAGSLGVMSCLDAEEGGAADFGGRRPKGRAALLRVSAQAEVASALLDGLSEGSTRESIRARIAGKVSGTTG